MTETDDQKGRSPVELQLEGASGGIDSLCSRIDRYGKAKLKALSSAQHIATVMQAEAATVEMVKLAHKPECRPTGFQDRLDGLTKLYRRVSECGDYLAFRHFHTVDQVKLHAASFCMHPLLCQLCAIRRGSRALQAYLDRWTFIKAAKPRLSTFLVTLTVKDGPDLSERFKHLHSSQRELWKRKSRGRGSVLDGVEGAVWSYEFKRGKNSGEWHPHLHMIALAESKPDVLKLRGAWKDITGDSWICDVSRDESRDDAETFMEVFKYAVKFSDQPPADTWHCFEVLKGKRLLASSGCFIGVEVPESLLDDAKALTELPFFEFFYRYLSAGCYSLQANKAGPGR